MSLKGKRILLGVTGSIAAYKSAILTRFLVKEGAEVQIIMSASAFDFITPLTLSTLSKKPVLSRFKKDDTGEWNNHVELGLWADLFLVAPISANTLSKFAHGACDNLLTAVYLSARCPVMVAPAMDLDMYQHPSVQNSMNLLRSFGNTILEAESGELASGLSGKGRMMEPEHILEQVRRHFSTPKDFIGKKVLVTLGPTQEALDPVRFISNHSSGKMGLAIARDFAKRGAEVFVVAGPISLEVEKEIFHWVDVVSAEEMYQEAKKIHQAMDICVFTAAVADYKSAEISSEKIKKSGVKMDLNLTKNVDIAASLGKEKKSSQVHVGFALETENEKVNAKAKLKRKNFDLIVLNCLREPTAGFQKDTNKVDIFHSSGLQISVPTAQKSQIASLILDEIKNIPVWV